jgi:hypothetical protein
MQSIEPISIVENSNSLVVESFETNAKDSPAKAGGQLIYTIIMAENSESPNG